MLDLVVRNAVVHDGSGMPPYRGEVGIQDGRIVRVGRVRQAQRQLVRGGGLPRRVAC